MAMENEMTAGNLLKRLRRDYKNMRARAERERRANGVVFNDRYLRLYAATKDLKTAIAVVSATLGATNGK